MEIEKQETPDVPAEVAVESPLSGEDQSFGDLKPGEQTSDMSEQEAMSQGGAEDQQRTDGVNPQEDLGPSAGEAPEGAVPELNNGKNPVAPQNPDIANAVEPQDSFWGGAFGKPRIPTVGE
jgi:hypothetical protein